MTDFTRVKHEDNEHYRVVTMVWDLGGPDETELEMAYNFDDDYIGEIEHADYICKELGIKPEKISKELDICNIGYSEKDNKYYGWSHRAICGFSIGDEVKEGDVVVEEGIEVGFKAKTKEDTKKLAKAFAKNVS